MQLMFDVNCVIKVVFHLADEASNSAQNVNIFHFCQGPWVLEKFYSFVCKDHLFSFFFSL